MPYNPESLNLSGFSGLYEILTILRSPDGCPWDRKQTRTSMKSDLIEEVYECIDAIDSGDTEHLKEELGDVLLIVSMIMRICEEDGDFPPGEVFSEICEKLIRRHPHVFGEESAEDADQVKKRWEEIKVQVEGRVDHHQYLATVPKNLPPLERAYHLQKKASKVGFDWENTSQVFDKLREEIDELEETFRREESQDRRIEELGDTLFSLINISRFLKIDPSLALHGANRKFFNRFHYVENGMKDRGLPLAKEHFTLMDGLWDEAKNRGIK